ncbi:hypothetical protein NLJ89_g8786 [Agrocybe chaxingu]|uniref:Uncharacterized protein n=1 Tax=Agrocybe chaxingu TaxID=84603 RepID=A0A9W8MQG9_9AGAR|nr:hypothetical protein NLJ89_g8786 [Agrocybe chaxingu]
MIPDECRLYGVTSVQTFLYFNDVGNRRDSCTLKLMVAFLWILDTVHMAFTTHGLYFYLVTNFGKLEVILSPVWSLLSGVYVTALSDFTVRAFFAKRVYILCGEKRFLARFLPIIIMALSLVVFAFACGTLHAQLQVKCSRMNISLQDLRLEVYINSLLASLNTRSALRNQGCGGVITVPTQVLTPIEFPIKDSEMEMSRSKGLRSDIEQRVLNSQETGTTALGNGGSGGDESDEGDNDSPASPTATKTRKVTSSKQSITNSPPAPTRKTVTTSSQPSTTPPITTPDSTSPAPITSISSATALSTSTSQLVDPASSALGTSPAPSAIQT